MTGNYFVTFLLPGAQGFTHQNIDFRHFNPRGGGGGGYILKTKFALRAKKMKEIVSESPKNTDRIIEDRIIEEVLYVIKTYK